MIRRDFATSLRIPPTIILPTRSSISLPALKVTTFLAGMMTGSPVRGLRARREARRWTAKTGTWTPVKADARALSLELLRS